MQTKKLAEKYKDYVITMRREFHMNPEASMEEYNTSRRIREELDKAGIENKSIAGTGVIATIKGSHPGKTVALRGDIDALAVIEESGKEYASKIHGLMHACGHDTHGAMLLGSAMVLNEMKDQINGTVKFFFQPGEEVGKGAAAMVAEGALEGVDSVMGMHISSGLPAGTINADPGAKTASADYFKITVTGKGGHGAEPEKTIDAVVVGSAVVMNIQSLVSREFSPFDPLVVTIGSIHSGTRFNVIAPRAVIEGTVRYYNPEFKEKVPAAIERIAKATAEAYRATAEMEYSNLVKITINDDICTSIARESAGKIVGQENVVETPPATGGEDFSEFSSIVPGVMCNLGARNEEKGIIYPHHHGKFDVDEDVFVDGVAFYAQYALDFLEKNKG
ncbi:amidohydrolase [Fusobacterium sp.]|uniref:amidohydrolase n=1 Tax=Fusobacterium sp. TaxID=68766 RepID=UPI0029021977|nr:amidohydrolase [Fusobacterium sp.]MDU1911893.1 amidohydrolase [Fusobacterium sp.]